VRRSGRDRYDRKLHLPGSSITLRVPVDKVWPARV
jgi:hypothetical protein